MPQARLRVDKNQRAVDDRAIRHFLVSRGKGQVGQGDLTEESAITFLISLTQPRILELHTRNIEKFIMNCHSKGSKSLSVNLKGWLHNISKSKKFQWAIEGADPLQVYLKTMRIVYGAKNEPTKLDIIAKTLRDQKKIVEKYSELAARQVKEDFANISSEQALAIQPLRNPPGLEMAGN